MINACWSAWSMHVEQHDQCMLSSMINACWAAWSVHVEQHDQCMLSSMINACWAAWSVHVEQHDQCKLSSMISACWAAWSMHVEHHYQRMFSSIIYWFITFLKHCFTFVKFYQLWLVTRVALPDSFSKELRPSESVQPSSHINRPWALD